jgi:hypothetical protein
MRTLLFACALTRACLGAGPAEKIDPALAARVTALLRDLNSDNFATRDAASTKLDALPGEALPLIEEALSTGELSPEVSLRLDAKVSLLRRKAAATAYEKSLQRELEWSRTTALAAYDNGGHTNPEWDAAAREAIVLQVRPRFDPNRSSKDDARISAAIEKAIDLGCDDPFVLYIHANRYRLTLGHDPQRAFEMMNRAAGGVLAGNYPPFRKLMAAARRAETRCAVEPDRLTIAARRELEQDLQTALSLFPDAAKDGTPRPFLHEAAMALHPAFTRLLQDHDKAFEKVYAALKSATPDSNVADIFAADIHLARTDVIRNDREFRGHRLLPAEKGKLIDELNAKAKAAVDAALAIDPQDPIALIDMLRLLTYTNVHRDEFEKWFEKSMAVYPNNLRACQIKRSYLERGDSSHEQAIEFGRQCLEGGNWSARIPLIIVDVHLNIARFDRPEEHLSKDDVWNDVKAAEEGYLKRYPNAVYDRTNYAKVASHSGHWDVAKAQFDLLGDNGVYSVFRGKQTYDYYRNKANRLAKP